MASGLSRADLERASSLSSPLLAAAANDASPSSASSSSLESLPKQYRSPSPLDRSNTIHVDDCDDLIALLDRAAPLAFALGIAAAHSNAEYDVCVARLRSKLKNGGAGRIPREEFAEAVLRAWEEQQLPAGIASDGPFQDEEEVDDQHHQQQHATRHPRVDEAAALLADAPIASAAAAATDASAPPALADGLGTPSGGAAPPLARTRSVTRIAGGEGVKSIPPPFSPPASGSVGVSGATTTAAVGGSQVPGITGITEPPLFSPRVMTHAEHRVLPTTADNVMAVALDAFDMIDCKRIGTVLLGDLTSFFVDSSALCVTQRSVLSALPPWLLVEGTVGTASRRPRRLRSVPGRSSLIVIDSLGIVYIYDEDKQTTRKLQLATQCAAALDCTYVDAENGYVISTVAGDLLFYDIHLKAYDPNKARESIQHVQWNAVQSLVVAADRSGTISLWRIRKAHPAARLKIPIVEREICVNAGFASCALAYHRRLGTIVVGFEGGMVAVIHPVTGRVERSFTTTSPIISELAISEATNTILVGTNHPDPELWSLTDSEGTKPFILETRETPHVTPIVSVYCAPHSSHAFTLDFSGVLKSWDLDTLQSLQTFFLPKDDIKVCWSSLAPCGVASETIYVTDRKSIRHLIMLRVSKTNTHVTEDVGSTLRNTPIFLAHLPGSPSFLVSVGGRNATFWKPQTGEVSGDVVASPQAVEGLAPTSAQEALLEVTAVCVSNARSTLFFGTAGGTVWVMNAATCGVMAEFRHIHKGRVVAVTFVDHANFGVSLGADGNVFILSPPRAVALAALQDPAGNLQLVMRGQLILRGFAGGSMCQHYSCASKGEFLLVSDALMTIHIYDCDYIEASGRVMLRATLPFPPAAALSHHQPPAGSSEALFRAAGRCVIAIRQIELNTQRTLLVDNSSFALVEMFAQEPAVLARHNVEWMHDGTVCCAELLQQLKTQLTLVLGFESGLLVTVDVSQMIGAGGTALPVNLRSVKLRSSIASLCLLQDYENCTNGAISPRLAASGGATNNPLHAITGGAGGGGRQILSSKNTVVCQQTDHLAVGLGDGFVDLFDVLALNMLWSSNPQTAFVPKPVLFSAPKLTKLAKYSYAEIPKGGGRKGFAQIAAAIAFGKKKGLLGPAGSPLVASASSPPAASSFSSFPLHRKGGAGGSSGHFSCSPSGSSGHFSSSPSGSSPTDVPPPLLLAPSEARRTSPVPALRGGAGESAPPSLATASAIHHSASFRGKAAAAAAAAAAEEAGAPSPPPALTSAGNATAAFLPLGGGDGGGGGGMLPPSAGNATGGGGAGAAMDAMDATESGVTFDDAGAGPFSSSAVLPPPPFRCSLASRTLRAVGSAGGGDRSATTAAASSHAAASDHPDAPRDVGAHVVPSAGHDDIHASSSTTLQPGGDATVAVSAHDAAAAKHKQWVDHQLRSLVPDYDDAARLYAEVLKHRKDDKVLFTTANLLIKVYAGSDPFGDSEPAVFPKRASRRKGRAGGGAGGGSPASKSPPRALYTPPPPPKIIAQREKDPKEVFLEKKFGLAALEHLRQSVPTPGAPPIRLHSAAIPNLRSMREVAMAEDNKWKESSLRTGSMLRPLSSSSLSLTSGGGGGVYHCASPTSDGGDGGVVSPSAAAGWRPASGQQLPLFASVMMSDVSPLGLLHMDSPPPPPSRGAVAAVPASNSSTAPSPLVAGRLSPSPTSAALVLPRASPSPSAALQPPSLLASPAALSASLLLPPAAGVGLPARPGSSGGFASTPCADLDSVLLSRPLSSSAAVRGMSSSASPGGPGGTAGPAGECQRWLCPGGTAGAKPSLRMSSSSQGSYRHGGGAAAVGGLRVRPASSAMAASDPTVERHLVQQHQQHHHNSMARRHRLLGPAASLPPWME